jgi:hypothetical protein
MSFLVLLAEEAATAMPTNLSGLVGVLVGGVGVGSILTILARGLWAKHGAPEVQLAIDAWYGTPKAFEERRLLIKSVIENEIRRNDGLISLELNAAIGQVKTEILSLIQTLEENTRQSLEPVMRLSSEDARFRARIQDDVQRIKTALNLLTKGVMGNPSDDSFVAVEPTRPYAAATPKPGSGGYKNPDGTGGYRSIKK